MGTHPREDLAFLFAFVGLAIVATKSLAGAYATYIQATIAAKVGCSLRLELLDALLSQHQLRQPRQNDHGSAPAAAVLALTERAHEVEWGLSCGVFGGLRAIAQLVPLGLVLVALSAPMALVAASVFATFGWLIGRVRGRYRQSVTQAGKEQAFLLEAADDCVRHADLWVAFGAERRARATIRALGGKLARGSARLATLAVLLSGTNEVLGAGALVLALAAQREGWLGPVDTTTVLAFAIPFFLAYRPLRELSDARLALLGAEAAYDELRAVVGPARLYEAVKLSDRDEGPRSRPQWPLGVLELRGLRLARGASGPISLRIEPGAVIVVVGPTAVGKTTLLRTLLGLERPADGEIVFDQAAIGDAPAGPLTRPFTWVPQDAPLLSDTLIRNISLGLSSGLAPGEALSSLGAAHLLEWLQTVKLGAGGRSVSGGERQWIAIARALATRQPVMLLDEPTSGLDPAAQNSVLSAISTLRGHRTVIVVTHRPEPVAIADVVVRLEPHRAALIEQRAA